MTIENKGLDSLRPGTSGQVLAVIDDVTAYVDADAPEIKPSSDGLFDNPFFKFNDF